MINELAEGISIHLYAQIDCILLSFVIEMAWKNRLSSNLLDRRETKSNYTLTDAIR